jgi:hypothetical protein
VNAVTFCLDVRYFPQKLKVVPFLGREDGIKEFEKNL